MDTNKHSLTGMTEFCCWVLRVGPVDEVGWGGGRLFMRKEGVKRK